MEDPVDCDTGSPMADTQVRQVFLVAGGGEAVATEYVRSSRLFFTRWFEGESQKGRGYEFCARTWWRRCMIGDVGIGG